MSSLFHPRLYFVLPVEPDVDGRSPRAAPPRGGEPVLSLETPSKESSISGREERRKHFHSHFHHHIVEFLLFTGAHDTAPHKMNDRVCVTTRIRDVYHGRGAR